MQLGYSDGTGALSGRSLDAEALSALLAALMDHSVYARQDELDNGFFTLDDGCRVGVCGRMVREGDRFHMARIASVCIRVARPRPGCADALAAIVDAPEGLCPILLASPPGLGKTTLLRDIARQLSRRGFCVGIADERHELAACRMGVPTLDVGPCADVLDGCPRPGAIRRLVRTMAPDIVVADEIGTDEDALALTDAARCGVAIAASAHARGMDELMKRPSLQAVLEGGVLEYVALLGPVPGRIRELWHRESEGGVGTWRRE